MGVTSLNLNYSLLVEKGVRSRSPVLLACHVSCFARARATPRWQAAWSLAGPRSRRTWGAAGSHLWLSIIPFPGSWVGITWRGIIDNQRCDPLVQTPWSMRPRGHGWPSQPCHIWGVIFIPFEPIDASLKAATRRDGARSALDATALGRRFDKLSMTSRGHVLSPGDNPGGHGVK